MKQKLILTALLVVTIFSFAKAQVPGYVPSNGLIGWWNFNGNVNDLSGLGNNGTPINSPTYANDRYGNINSCIKLNGINQRVDLPLNLNGALINLNKISISCYVKIDTSAGYYAVFSNWKAFPLTDPFGFEVLTDDAKFRGSTNGGTGVYADSSIYKGIWNHVVVTFDGSINGTQSKMKIYINGALHSTDTMPNVYSNCLSNNLGNSATNTAFGAWISQFGWVGYLKGNLDDIGIWNRTLTQQEITALYNAQPCTPQIVYVHDTVYQAPPCLPNYVPTTGLVGWWPFCGNANDESGNGNNGTVNGATLTTDRFGNIGKAYSFNSATAQSIHSNIGIHNSKLTFSAWFKCGSPSTYYPRIITYGNSTQQVTVDYYQIGLSGNEPSYIPNWIGKTTALANFNNTNGVNSILTYDNNLWHNLIVIYDPTDSIYLYMDGIKVASTKFLGSTTFTDDNLYIGRDINDAAGACNGCGRFNGKIDDIGIWNRALTQQEITALYTASPCTQIVTLYDTFTTHIQDTIITHISINDTLTTQLYDTLTTHIAINDTTHYNVFDTLTMNITLHDTLTTHLYDTLTTHIAINDTTHYNVYDTLVTNITLHDTLTTHLFDTLTTHISINDTIPVYDSIHYAVYDTLTTHIYDTLTTHFSINDTIPVYDSIHYAIYDTITIHITINDTITHYLAVTDTLLINAVLTGVPGPNNINLVKVFPNPASDHLIINYGNYASMSGYSVKITNALAQTVYSSLIVQQQVSIDLSTWSGKGTYILNLLNGAGTVIETRKIVLQ